MDVTPFLGVLQSFGISISASAFLEFLKAYNQSRKTDDINEFKDHLQSFINMTGVSVKAETVINAFAHQGLISIQQSQLFANNQITIGAGQNAQFIFGNNSTSTTNRTQIVAQGNAQVVGKNAAMVQNPDGSISFCVGSNPGDSMSFFVGKK